jgi:hypothetical protein
MLKSVRRVTGPCALGGSAATLDARRVPVTVPFRTQQILRCVICGSFQPFLEALRGHEVISLKSIQESENAW